MKRIDIELQVELTDHNNDKHSRSITMPLNGFVGFCIGRCSIFITNKTSVRQYETISNTTEKENITLGELRKRIEYLESKDTSLANEEE